MKKFSSTWLFVVLVMGFALYVYQFEYVAVEEQEEAEEQAKAVIRFDPEDVSEIELVFGNESTLIQKQNNEWKLRQPVDDLADQSEVADLLKTLTEEKSELVVEGKEIDLKEFGLLKPKGQIRVQADEEEFKILVGTETSYDGEAYTMESGSDRVLLVKPVVANLIEKPIKDLRDKKILRDPVAPISMEIKSGKSATVAVKVVKDGNEWKLEGQKTPASPRQLASFFADINSLEASNFASENKTPDKLKEFGLILPALTITAKEQSGREIRVDFSQDKNGKRYVSPSDRDVILEIVGFKFDEFNKNNDHFKDSAQPFQFDTKQVQQMSISMPEIKLNLQKQGGHWMVDKKVEGKKIDEAKVQEVINSLGNLRVDQFLGDRNSETLSKPQNHMVLATSNGEKVFELKWAGPIESELEKDKKQKLYLAKTNLGHETLGLLLSKLDGLSFSNILTEDTDKQNEKDNANDTRNN